MAGTALSGDEELLQFAHLLRVGAEAARNIAMQRRIDQSAICDLAEQAEAIANDLNAIVAASKHGLADV